VSRLEEHLPADQTQAGQGHRVPFPGAVGKSGKEYFFPPEINTRHDAHSFLFSLTPSHLSLSGQRV